MTTAERVQRQAAIAQLEDRLTALWDEVREAWARPGRMRGTRRQPTDAALAGIVFGSGSDPVT